MDYCSSAVRSIAEMLGFTVMIGLLALNFTALIMALIMWALGLLRRRRDGL